MVEGCVWNVVVGFDWDRLVPNWTAVNGVRNPTQREKEEVTIPNLWLHMGEGEKGYPYILLAGTLSKQYSSSYLKALQKDA